MTESLGWALIIVGIGFFISGTIALLRFPDLLTRLHGLTKADNLGLGLIAIGLALQSNSWFGAAKLLLIWLVVMVSSASVSHLVARAAVAAGTNVKDPP